MAAQTVVALNHHLNADPDAAGDNRRRPFHRKSLFGSAEDKKETKLISKALRQENLTEFLDCYARTPRALFSLFSRCALAGLIAAYFIIVTSHTTNRGLENVVENFVHKIADGAPEVYDQDSLYLTLTTMAKNLFDPQDETSFQRIGIYNVFLGATLTVWPGKSPDKVPFGSEFLGYVTCECLDTPVHGCMEPPIEMWQMGHHGLEGAPVRYRTSSTPESFAPRCDGTQPYGEWDLFNQPDFDRLSHVAGFETNSKPYKSIRSGPYQVEPPPERALSEANLTSVLADLKWMKENDWVNMNHVAAKTTLFFYNVVQGYTTAVSIQWIVRDRDMTVEVEVLDQSGAMQFISHRYSATFCDIPKAHTNIIHYFPYVCGILFLFDMALTLWELRRCVLTPGLQNNKKLRNLAPPFKQFFLAIAPRDYSGPVRSPFNLVFQVTFFCLFWKSVHCANIFFEASSGAGDACADDETVLGDCDALPPSCGVHPCEGLEGDDRLVCCRRGMAYDSAYSVVSISRTRHDLVVQAAFMVIFLFCSTLTLFPGQNRLGMLYKTLKVSTSHLIHYSFGLLVILLGFAIAAHILFSHHVDGYGSVGNSLVRLLTMLVSGDIATSSFESAYPSDMLVAMGFYLLFGLISILVLANIFIAIVSEGYIDSNEKFDELRSVCVWGDVKDSAACPVRRMTSDCPSAKVDQQEVFRQCLTALRSLERNEDGMGAGEVSPEKKWEVLRAAVRTCRHGQRLNDALCDKILCRALRLPRPPYVTLATVGDLDSDDGSSDEIGGASPSKVFFADEKPQEAYYHPGGTEVTTNIPEDLSSAEQQEREHQNSSYPKVTWTEKDGFRVVDEYDHSTQFRVDLSNNNDDDTTDDGVSIRSGTTGTR